MRLSCRFQSSNESRLWRPQMRQRVYFVGFRNDLPIDITEFKWPDTVPMPDIQNYLIDENLASEERLEILQYYLNNPTNQGKYTVSDISQMEGKIIDTRMNDLQFMTENARLCVLNVMGFYMLKMKKYIN